MGYLVINDNDGGSIEGVFRTFESAQNFVMTRYGLKNFATKDAFIKYAYEHFIRITKVRGRP